MITHSSLVRGVIEQWSQTEGIDIKRKKICEDVSTTQFIYLFFSSLSLFYVCLVVIFLDSWWFSWLVICNHLDSLYAYLDYYIYDWSVELKLNRQSIALSIFLRTLVFSITTLTSIIKFRGSFTLTCEYDMLWKVSKIIQSPVSLTF